MVNIIMSSAAWEIPGSSPIKESSSGGNHTAYFFEDSAEKQRRLFRLVKDKLEDYSSSCFVLYIAGKQGTKGIRLSMKDAQIDVGSYERQKKLRIADSEEWYLSSGKIPSFKTPGDISSQFDVVVKESRAAGREELLVISETDQIVRKGFLKDYLEFENSATTMARVAKVSVLCAYDERELGAAHVPKNSVASLHGEIVS